LAHFLITGHTGFKGAWLTLLLKARGHEVSGLALDPLPRSVYNLANLKTDLNYDLRGDVRSLKETEGAFRKVQPDFVLHLAAQALVREGFKEPYQTYETNVLGTLNVLEASARSNTVRAQLLVTSDKVYAPMSKPRPYVESDPLGGDDPYSASKAMADILAQEWLTSGRTKPGAVVRAGNVIGAGDRSPDRLFPDIIRARETGADVKIRYPGASRPWQHVLDCLGGYLGLIEKIDSGLVPQGEAWNFGPNHGEAVLVSDVVLLAKEYLGKLAPNFVVEESETKEATYLSLDSSKANSILDWANRITLEEAVRDSLSEAVAHKSWDARGHIVSRIRSFEADQFR